MPRPHGPECRCPEPSPDEGLLHFTVDCDHFDQLASALAKMSGKTLVEVKPFSVVFKLDCDGSMTCSCETCEADRSSRVRHGVAAVRQPWEAAAA